jgi:hypothetical protein
MVVAGRRCGGEAAPTSPTHSSWGALADCPKRLSLTYFLKASLIFSPAPLRFDFA